MAQQAYGLPQQYSAYQMQNPYGPAAAQTMQRSDQADMQRKSKQAQQDQQASGARFDPMNMPMSRTMDMPQNYSTTPLPPVPQNYTTTSSPFALRQQNPIQSALTVDPQEFRMESAVMP
jgi:hypothetical protein